MSSLVKIVLIGILIVAIPVSVKLVQEQQILKSKAAEYNQPCSDLEGNYYDVGTSCGVEGRICDGRGSCIVSNPCADNQGNYYAVGTSCGDGTICDGYGKCVTNNRCADNQGNNYNAGTACGNPGDGRICDGHGNCIARNYCADNQGNNYPSGTPCEDGKVCDGRGKCVAVNLCADNQGNYYPRGTSCGNGKICNGYGRCIVNDGAPPQDGGAPNTPGGDTGAPGGGGVPIGCLADHSAGESWAECQGCNEGVTTCNVDGNYSFDSVKNPSPNCGSTCGGQETPPQQGTPGNVGVGTPDAPTAPGGGTAPSAETEDKPCKVPMASFSGNSSCTMVPNNSYKWVIVQPGTGGAPGIDVARFGANNACGDPGGDREAAHEVCPENTSDPLNVRASTSNWCYEFTEGNRCIQLRHDGTGGGPGGGGSPGIDTGTCNIDGQSPDLGPTCAACLDSKVPSVVSNIKNMNPTDFNGCSDQKIFNKWCNGFGGEAKGQCDALKAGACATSCGGSLPDPGPVTPVRRDLCVSTALSTETVAANGQITITTAAKEDKLRKFRYAFFNLDNGAKIICQQGIASVPDAKPAEQCPNGGMPFVVDESAASANAKSQAATFSFAQFDKPDLNWGGKKPTHIQVNGYFIDQFGMQSTANSTCSKGFNIAQGEVPSQIQFRAAESSFEDQETGWQPYTGAGMLHNYTFKDKTPGVKTIFVQFKDITTGKIQDASAQIELVAPPSPPPSPPPVVTKEFRIAESPTDLNSAQWQPYNSVPMKYDNFEFKDKKPGVKTIFVQFKDSNEKVSCGGNKTYCTTQIRLLGDDPAITSCSLGFEGNNTILNLQGKNFGSTKGIIKSGEAVLQVKGSWRDDSVQAILPNAQPGQNIPVTLTNTDGQIGEIPCSSVSQLSLGAKLFCRQPALHQTDNVDLTMVEAFAGGKKFNQKVTIDKDGIVQGLTQKLESGKDYVLSIKAPRSLRKNAPFKAGEGVTKIPNFTLWVGDIFPADGGDGLINSLDKQQLNREWNITSDVKGRSGDFNQDGRVNSIDWACMRVSMVDSAGRGDDPEPVPGIQVSPGGSLQSPGPSTSPAASPVASPSPSASPAI